MGQAETIQFHARGRQCDEFGPDARIIGGFAKGWLPSRNSREMPGPKRSMIGVHRQLETLILRLGVAGRSSGTIVAASAFEDREAA